MRSVGWNCWPCFRGRSWNWDAVTREPPPIRWGAPEWNEPGGLPRIRKWVAWNWDLGCSMCFGWSGPLRYRTSPREGHSWQRLSTALEATGFNGHALGQSLGDDEGQGGLACCHLWGRKKSDMTRQPNNHNPLQYSCRRILWTEESGRLQSMGSQRVRHNTVTEQQQQQHYKKMDQIWSLDLERHIEELNLQVWILLKNSMTCFSPPNPHFFTLIMTSWPNSIFPSRLSHWNSTWFGNPVLSSFPLPNAEWSCDWGRGRTKLSLSLFWAQAPLTVRSRKGKEEKHMSILCAGENSWPSGALGTPGDGAASPAGDIAPCLGWYPEIPNFPIIRCMFQCYPASISL